MRRVRDAAHGRSLPPSRTAYRPRHPERPQGRRAACFGPHGAHSLNAWQARTEVDAITSGRLGGIQRAVGGSDQLVAGLAMARESGNAERGRYGDLRYAVGDGRGRDRTTQQLSTLDGACFWHPGQDQQELLAAVAAVDIAAARLAL